MVVIDIAREDVVTHGPGATVSEVVGTMRRRAVSTVVVVDEGRPIDIVSDRDIALRIMETGFDPDEVEIGELVSDEIVTVEADAGMYELVQLMADEGVRRVPVVRDGELAGIVSISDVVVLLGMELQSVANIIRATSPAYERSATELFD